MSNPFRSLAPFSPRYVELEYIASAPACCPTAVPNAGPDIFWSVATVPETIEIPLSGTVLRDGNDVSAEGLINWKSIQAAGPVTFLSPDTKTPTVQLKGYVGKYILEMDFTESGKTDLDQLTLFAMHYEMGSAALTGWLTTIGGVNPKPILKLWRISGLNRVLVLALDHTLLTPGPSIFFGDHSEGGETTFFADIPDNESLTQRFFATLTYNIPNGSGGEVTVEKAVSLVNGLDPAFGALDPHLSNSGTSFFLVPVDGGGLPSYPVGPVTSPAVSAHWIPNAGAMGFQVQDYRIALALVHIDTFALTQT